MGESDHKQLEGKHLTVAYAEGKSNCSKKLWHFVSFEGVITPPVCLFWAKSCAEEMHCSFGTSVSVGVHQWQHIQWDGTKIRSTTTVLHLNLKKYQSYNLGWIRGILEVEHLKAIKNNIICNLLLELYFLSQHCVDLDDKLQLIDTVDYWQPCSCEGASLHCNLQAVKLMHKKYQDLAINQLYVLHHWTQPAKRWRSRYVQHPSMKGWSPCAVLFLNTDCWLLFLYFRATSSMVCFWRAIVLRKWVMFFLLFRAFSIYIGCANMMSRTCAVLRLVKTRKCSSSKTERQLQSFNVTFSSLFFQSWSVCFQKWLRACGWL